MRPRPFLTGMLLCLTPLLASPGDLIGQETEPDEKKFDFTFRGCEVRSSLSRQRDFLYSHQAYHGGLVQGDTLRVREVLLNAGDSTLTVKVRPCGMRLVTDMELESGPSDEPCEPVERILAPGDSVWAEAAAIVTAAPGSYFVSVDFAGLKDTKGGGFGFGVRPDESRDVRKRHCAIDLEEKLYYVVRLSGEFEEAGIEESDVGHVVTIATRGLMALHVKPAAAASLGATHPYLEIALHVDESGSQETRVCWVGLRGYAEGPCNASSGLVGPLSLGADLAEKVRSILRFRRTSDDPPDRSTEAGS